MSDFDGLVALITGGASGIGAATAELLRDRGAPGRRGGPRHRGRAGRDPRPAR